MVIHLNHTPYPVVNAHDNSLFQNTTGGWLTLHADHITHLKSALNRIADTVTVDFCAFYQTTFADDRRAHLLLNYSQEPTNFAAYRAPDQALITQIIAQHMA